MDNFDELRSRIGTVIFELKDILKLFEMEIADEQRAISFRQVKEIEALIERLKRQGLPVPNDLKQLKLKLFSTSEVHEKFLFLYNEFLGSINELISSKTPQKTGRSRFREPDNGQSSDPKHLNYKRPLGSRGYSNVEDYLMPVIKLMRDGLNHTEAFHRIANKLDVRYSTVSAQCTRALGLTMHEFINQVKSGTIIDLIEKKYPDQRHLINALLG